MIFSENNLYGWGTTDISMPRATFDPHPNRRKKNGKITGHSRGGAAAYRWHPSSTSRIFLDDYPWNQTLVLCIFSTLIIVYICILNSTLPNDLDKEVTKPVEIVVAMQKAEPQAETISGEQQPLAAVQPEHNEKNVTFESAIEKPQKKVIDKPKQVEQDVVEKTPEITPQPASPLVKIKPKDLPKKAKEPQRIASAMPDMEVQTKPKNITISPPINRERNYTAKTPNTNLQPRQTSKVASFVSAKDKKPTKKIDEIGSYKNKKQYLIKNDKKLGDPQLKTTANLVALNQTDKKMEPVSLKTKSASQRYSTRANTLLPAVQGAPPSANQQLLFPSQRREKIPGLEPKKLYSQFNKPSTSSPSVSKKTKKISRSKKQGLSFQSKERKESPTLPPLVANKSLTNAKRSSGKSTDALAKAHNFPEKLTPGEIEAAELINLSDFNVCIDPEKEFRQKTQLAAHLDRPSRIEADGVVFFIKYTESGYTIEIGVYNPQGRLFEDRCEVLELAINSIANRVN